MSSKIMLVEDEELVRSMMSDFLTAAGYSVIEAVNADAALDLLKAGMHIDLVFSDIKMPGSLDGCELAQRIRSGWPAIRVVLATGYNSGWSRAKTAHEKVIPKPYRPRDVLTTIVTVIGPDVPTAGMVPAG